MKNTSNKLITQVQVYKDLGPGLDLLGIVHSKQVSALIFLVHNMLISIHFSQHVNENKTYTEVENTAYDTYIFFGEYTLLLNTLYTVGVVKT